jgi:serine/threonine protein kinase
VSIDSNELSGRVLGTCTLQHLLGRGGMGVVYLARQSRPRRTVAVKVLLPAMHTDSGARTEFLARFRREADAIAALDHINIMPIYEYGEQGEMAYLVMPFVTGGTLRTLLEQKKILSLTEVLPIVKQAAAALDTAHAQGIVHRDLKPGNILFHGDGRVLLADFGLAKVVRGSNDSGSSDSLTTLTSVGTIIGTPEYLSPEQSTGQPIGPHTDIYALGIVLYQMLGGRVPFTGSSPVSIALKHTMEKPPSLLRLNPALSPAIEAVVMKALAKLPEERFKSAGELAQAFYDATQDTPPTLNQIQVAPVANMAKITISDEQNGDTHADSITEADAESFEDDSQVETAASRSVTPPMSISKLPTGEQAGISPAKEVAFPEYHIQEHVHLEKPGLHTSETIEAPLPTSFEAPTAPLKQVSPILEPPSIHQASPVLTPPTPVQHSPVNILKQQATPSEIAPTHVKQSTDRPPTPQRSGCQSVGMMLLGSLLTLVLVVGGFIGYLVLVQKNNSSPTQIITNAPQATKTAVTQAHLFTPPASLISTAGNVLYGTASPGPQCDAQGGQWSAQSGIQVTCKPKSNETQLANTGNSTAGIFLNKLAHGQDIPENYVLQVQMNFSSTTQGYFGVFFRNQSTSPIGACSYLMNAASRWTGNIYDNQRGVVTPLFHSSLPEKVNGSVTLDITIKGGTYAFYVNKAYLGYIGTGLYTGGNLGLVVDPGTIVTFKDLVIYSF